MKKKVLFIAPYGSWLVHHQVDAILAKALEMRGCDVLIMRCDGIFQNCPLRSLVGQKNNHCKVCQQKGDELFSLFKLPGVLISSLLNHNEIRISKEWASSLAVEELPLAVFKGKNFGKWVSPAMHSKFVTGFLDYSNKRIVEVNRNFLYNAALIYHAFEKLIQIYYPDSIVCFSAYHLYYRIVFKLARDKGIDVLTHERGMQNDSFVFYHNETSGLYEGAIKSWNEWKEVPLSLDKCQKVKKYFLDREVGKNTNFVPFYSYSSKESLVRKKLRIPDNVKMVTLLHSADRELEMAKWDLEKGFPSQFDGIKEYINLFINRNEYLVIRYHPHRSGLEYADPPMLKKILELNKNIPENVRVIMPNEKLTSYAIVWNADAAITFGTTMGIESLMRGLAVSSNVKTIDTALDFGSKMIKSIKDCNHAIDETIQRTENFSINDLTYVYRGAYHTYFRGCWIFNSLGILDIFKPDIRINNINELLEGNDPALDLICNHILYNTPLYPAPNEELTITDYEETRFLENEIKLIQEKRERIKNNVTNLEETMISIVRIRQNAINEILEPLTPPQDTVFYQTVQRSRHKNIENINMSFLPDYNGSNFIQSFFETIDKSKGDYIYFGTDNTYVDESLFSSSVDYLEENIECDGVLTGAWTSDKNGNITGELFTERNKTTEYNAIYSVFPQIKNPAQLLAFIVWKKTSLVHFTSQLNMDQSLEKISFEMFKKIFLDESQFNFKKSLIPNINIYEPFTANDYLNNGIELLEKNQFRNATMQFDKAKILNNSIKDLNFLRAFTKFQCKELWSARLAADTQLDIKPTDKRCHDLRSEIMSKIGDPTITFQDVSASLNTIDSQLVKGQDKFLFDKVKSLPENAAVLEIGSRYGSSTASLAYACVGSNKKIYCIDTFGSVSLCFMDIWKSTILRLDLEKYVIPLRGSSHEKLLQLGDKPIFDFAFIDASHYYTDVIKDFYLVYPLIKVGGFIAFHDIDWPGPMKLWHETAKFYLSNHEYYSNLACGRKIKDIKLTHQQHSQFSFSNYFVEIIKIFNPQLSEDLATSMQHLPNNIQTVEHNISLMPGKYKKHIKTIIDLIIHEQDNCEDTIIELDPFILYWNALTLEYEDDKQNALVHMQMAKKILKTMPKKHLNLNSRINVHINRLKSNDTKIDINNLSRYYNIMNGFGDLNIQLSNRVCKISYFGASVTAQNQGYIFNLHQNIKNRFNKNHILFQKGFVDQNISNAIPIINDHITCDKPDLCFMEWTLYPSTINEDLFVKNIETIILKFKKINCKICFLLLGFNVSDKSKNLKEICIEKSDILVSTIEKICEKHYIPSVNIYKYLIDFQKSLQCSNENYLFDNLFNNYIHTTNSGSYLYGKLIFNAFEYMLKNKL